MPFIAHNYFIIFLFSYNLYRNPFQYWLKKKEKLIFRNENSKVFGLWLVVPELGCCQPCPWGWTFVMVSKLGCDQSGPRWGILVGVEDPGLLGRCVGVPDVAAVSVRSGGLDRSIIIYLIHISACWSRLFLWNDGRLQNWNRNWILQEVFQFAIQDHLIQLNLDCLRLMLVYITADFAFELLNLVTTFAVEHD